MAGTHGRAGWVPGDLKCAQLVWKRSPGLGMCGRLTGVGSRPGTPLRRAQRPGGLEGRFVDGAGTQGLQMGEHHAGSLGPSSATGNSAAPIRTGA